MNLEVKVDDQITYRATTGDGPDDPRSQWAAKVEERAREIFKGSPDRIFFRYDAGGVKLLSDGESKVPLLIAVRELYEQMPASVQAYMLDVTAILESRHTS
ncbi:MAG: hypothetical protein JRN08_08340 [Nitrososphaerota archaeon]|nr:hypothetical protein [Nitrososphaerota archaeon]